MKAEFKKGFIKELEGFFANGIKDFKRKVLEGIELLAENDGFIDKQVTYIRNHKPLKEYIMNDFRVFFTIEGDTLIIRSIVRKDQNRLKPNEFVRILNL